MAIITQNYDIDLKATGEYPVVKMSQFDTGSRTIVFTVYDGHDLAQIDGMVARVDGTRSDGVEFSSTCTVGTGSKVSFTISQEMTKVSGKHTAELVIFDAEGNPIGTQNFLIEVEAASMSRDSAASADDRALYDQYTDSVEHKFSKLSTSLTAKADALNKTVEDISGLVGASSKPTTIYDNNVQLNGVDTIHVRLTYDPMTALVHAHAYGSLSLSTRNDSQYSLCEIDSKYCPDKGFFDYTSGGGTGYYIISTDNTKGVISGDTSETSDLQQFYIEENGGVYTLRFYRSMLPDHVVPYQLSLNAVWYARGGKYIGVTSIGTGGNTLKIGKTTTGAPGAQASVVNSGTANDVVLDFTIPKGAKGDKGDKGDVGLPALVVKKPLINEYPVGDTFTWNVSELLNRTPLVNEYSTALSGNGKYIIVWQCVSQSDSQFTGKTISRQSIIGAQGPKGDKGDTGPQGAKGDTGARGNRIYLSSYEALPNTGSHQWTDLTPVPSVANPPIVGDFLITPAGNLMPITGNKLDPHSGGGGRYDVGGILINLKGRKGDKGDKGEGVYTLPAATATTLGGVKIGAGINVSADGTIDVQGLVGSISQMQSKYDALISSATYEVGSGLTKGAWYDDYTWKFCRLRVAGGVCTLSFSASRKSAAWNAKAWDSAHVLTLPEGLGSLGEVHMPIVTNANGEPNNNTALQVKGNEVVFRPTVGVNYGTGTWFEGTVSWVAAGSQS